MTKKQFNDKKFHLNEDFCIVKNDCNVGYDLEDTVDLLNQYYYLYQICEEKNRQLKQELNSFKPVVFQDTTNNGTILLYAKEYSDNDD